MAVWPAVVYIGGPGRLYIEALAGLLAVAQFAALAPVWRVEEPLDRMFHAVLAGGITGLGLATTPLFAAFLLGAWVAFVCTVYRARGEERQNAARVAILFWITAALISQLPVLGGPWLPASEGPVAGWCEALRLVVMIGAVPLIIGLGAEGRVGGRPRTTIALVLALGTAGVIQVSGGFDAEPASALLAALRPTWGGEGGSDLLRGPAILWAGLFLLGLARDRAGPAAERVFISVTGLATLLVAALSPPATVLFAGPAALSLARRLQSSNSALRGGLLCTVLLLWSGLGLASRPDSGDRDRDREIARAARWLRENTEPPGPWNSATAVQTWGVACSDSAAPLVVWYGRRPVAPLAAGGLETLAGSARARGLRYLLLESEATDKGGWPAEFEALRRAGESLPPGFSVAWTPAGDPPPGLVWIDLVSDPR